MSRETIGKIATDLSQKDQSNHTPTDQMREQLSEYDFNLSLSVEEFKKQYPWHSGDFYIVVITKREPLLPNVIRNYFVPRMSCPTPDYDQTVYKYSRGKTMDNMSFLWVIPSRETCFFMRENALLVPKDQKELLQFVLQFSDGSLYKLCKKLNGEKDNSIELEKGTYDR